MDVLLRVDEATVQIELKKKPNNFLFTQYRPAQSGNNY